MKEGANSVKRLLAALESVDQRDLPTLARILNYREKQLVEDLGEIQKVKVEKK